MAILDVEEEEGLVAAVVYFRNPHGTADIAAEVVLPRSRPEPASVSVDLKRVPRVELLIGGIGVGRAVELVRARASRHVDQRSADLAVLGRVVARLNGGLLQRIHRGLLVEKALRIERTAGVHSVHAYCRSGNRQAVKLHIGSPARAETGARREDGDAQRIANEASSRPLDRQVVDDFPLDGGALLRGFGLQERGHGRDLDGFGHGAHHELHVHAQRLRHVHPQPGLLIFAEALLFRGERIGSRGQRWNRIVAGVGRRHRGLGPCRDVRRRDLDPRNHGAGGIGDSASDHAPVALGRHKCGDDQQQGCQQQHLAGR